jgi:polyhydroxyalkanoate synthesis regulator protein
LSGDSPRSGPAARNQASVDAAMATLIKRYANRKLYNTQTSRYISIMVIMELIEEGL